MDTEATARSDILFPSARFNPAPVYIGGLGGVGCQAAVALAKLGVANVIGCDTQTVATANIGTALYGPEHVDKPKALMCAQLVRELSPMMMRAHQCYIQDLELEGVVFLCVDDMDVRKDVVLEQCVPRDGEQKVARVFESRMSAETLTVHSFDPGNEAHVAEWLRYWFPQREALPALAGCGATPVAPDFTACVTSRIMTALFVRWFAHEIGRAPVSPNQVRYDFTTFEGTSYTW